MNMWAHENKLYISVSNIPAFYALAAQAKEEADKLRETVRRLSQFELEIDFSAHAGDMEAASSDISTMPTK